MNNIFSTSRIIKLIRKDLFSEYKNLIIWLGTSAAVLIVISALDILFHKLQGAPVSNSGQFHFNFFVILLFPGGYILSSSMFKDVHDKVRNIYWLTLPGSTFEKMLSRLLISSVLYIVLLTLLYPVLALLSETFNLLIFNMRHAWFNPFRLNILKMLPYYLVTQSLFFAGATAFRKHPFAKTILSLALFQILLSIVLALLAKIFFSGMFESVQNLNFTNHDFLHFRGSNIVDFTRFSRFMIIAGKTFFWGIMAPFFYVFSYFKLAEKEVRDGF